MKNIINKFLPAGDTYMPERHLGELVCGPFTKSKTRNKVETQDISIGINYAKLVFSMICHMEISKIS